MNYHTNPAPSPLKETFHENEAVLIRSYIVKRKTYFFFKRLFDIIFSLLFTVLILSWLIPLVGFLIMIDSSGPVFFIQRRVGKNGRPFYCLKFRTMIANDEADEKQAEENDCRITRVGKLLRRINMDEFPQFLNVLNGDMSIIGPRPHMTSDCIKFSFVIPAYQFRSLMRPGITGLAQVKGYHGPTTDYESIFTRYHWDAEYIRNAGFWLDLKIIFLTAMQSLGNLIYLGFCFLGRKKTTEEEMM
jgi:putative colanic acid biosynthesis UDP-glucose lipid carrier transferase